MRIIVEVELGKIFVRAKLELRKTRKNKLTNIRKKKHLQRVSDALLQVPRNSAEKNTVKLDEIRNLRLITKIVNDIAHEGCTYTRLHKKETALVKSHIKRSNNMLRVAFTPDTTIPPVAPHLAPFMDDELL